MLPTDAANEAGPWWLIERHDGYVVLRSTFSDKERGLSGTLCEEVRPGGSFLGWTYEEVLALGWGMRPRPGWRPTETG
jgi:hypothetical protein